MPRSITGWFTLCWAAFLVGAVVVGVLLVSLYRQTTTAQIRHGQAAVAQGCDAIAGRYSFLMAGSTTAPDLADKRLHAGLTQAIGIALRTQAGVEGGIWSPDRGSLAYAYPTYEGTGPKTDVPEAELPSIRALADAAAQDSSALARRWRSGSEVLLLYACPLPGPIADLSAWTMTRIDTAGSAAFLQAIAGLAVLLVLLLGSATWLWAKLRLWSAELRRLEAALASGDKALPHLALTGQRDLDRIIASVNAAGVRLDEARARAAALSAEMARGERLAALGRVAAGVAHEVRNPIAAMRLKAENALAPEAGTARKDAALGTILEQIARLDRLTRNLLQSVRGGAPSVRTVNLPGFLAGRLALFKEQAEAHGVGLVLQSGAPAAATFDPDRIGPAVDNLLLNAIQHTPAGGAVRVSAAPAGQGVAIAVHDAGGGVAPELRQHLFEPFATGRRQGTGLGLSIVREAAAAHGGTVRAEHRADGTSFIIELPACPAS